MNMSINLSQLGPFLWIVAAVLALVIVVVLVRFFFKHILRWALHGCAAILVLIVVLAILTYFKVILIY
jgi:hypothetical protein